MTKVEKCGTNGIVTIDDGKVIVFKDGIRTVVGKIAYVELNIEHPKQMPGICRIEHVMLYNDKKEALYEDQEIVNNTEYHTEKELIDAVAEHYGVSRNAIKGI